MKNIGTYKLSFEETTNEKISRLIKLRRQFDDDNEMQERINEELTKLYEDKYTR